jgi:glutamate synthase domain-containing protein 2/glutamate synthase domain-containing protein 1/glutamate synthase domain-containing protein 3
MYAQLPPHARQHAPLWDPAYEHDACGTGFVARLDGVAQHAIVQQALEALVNLTHRGAVAADAKTGDGAGLMLQTPGRLLAREVAALTGRAVPATAVVAGMVFCPADADQSRACRDVLGDALAGAGVEVLAWRGVPVNPAVLGDKARETMPDIWQVLVMRPEGDLAAFERALYLARRRAEKTISAAGIADFSVPSLSARTLVYKGLFVGSDLGGFYRDLTDPDCQSALAIFHQRYSTNTFPTWALAQPFRRLAHNGEINTLLGNRGWMRAREPELTASVWGDAVADLLPVIDPHGSDSASLDNLLELLEVSGRDICQAMAVLLPEAWEQLAQMPAALRAFYAYHAPLFEPWDGPAAIAFSDGRVAAATLDRNGLRPLRYSVTAGGLVVVASETGVLDLRDEQVIERGRLGPGQMLAVDTATGTLWHNDELKHDLAARRPWTAWVSAGVHRLPGGPVTGGTPPSAETPDLLAAQHTFGFTAEDQRLVVQPMAAEGKEPLWSMGDDAPLAVLSRFPRPLASFFRQRFAQVTNPPIDPLREALVMALDVYLGPRRSILEETPEHARVLHLASPILSAAQLDMLADHGAVTLDATFPADPAIETLEAALDRLAGDACDAVTWGAPLLVLSDRAIGPERVPLPMLLATGIVHQRLIAAGLRMRASLVCDTGDIWDVHQAATLLGYGASAVHPWLALRAAASLAGARGLEEVTAAQLQARYTASLEAGLLKIMSKMGISALAGYTGGQQFEVLGLAPEVVARCFTGTPARLGGLGFEALATRVLDRHATAWADPAAKLPDPGMVRFRKDGEYHAFSPSTARILQDAATTGDPLDFAAYVQVVQARAPATIRDLLAVVPTTPIPLEEVEPVEDIRRRFVVTAMSLGALSPEAYRTLAIAMNRIGARSNSGEGGEDPAWYHEDGPDIAHSRVKQIASGRFGVTAEYLSRATEIEIKMAQGSKPGEGGQLPAHKVTPLIARLRHAVPGISLISPPPHHDIYSIEDLAQLIYDLKQVNPRARVGVKLVAEAGVGTVAAGVAKAHADYILISGHAGGTGASPLSSIKHVGVPWELGLAETQQTLVLNDLRGRVTLRTDGGLQTGRDIIIAAMLGAEEFGLGTAALVSIGCDMARQCHLNSCPTGIATQREDLRARFKGTPEQVIAFFTSLAADVRAHLAALGARSLDDIVGRADLLRQSDTPSPLDLSDLLAVPPGKNLRATVTTNTVDDAGGATLDSLLLPHVLPALGARRTVSLAAEVRNHHRSVGAMLAGELALRHGRHPLPGGTVELCLRGVAGQSFGAWCTPGLRLVLDGEANDYVGKGMSGGEIVIRRPAAMAGDTRPRVIIGNTVLYGATGGELFVAGQAGERFAVRNSGATAVVEGVGDHGCEYMTGGTVVILGPTGRNFGAGMTNGTAYVWDPDHDFAARCHPEFIDPQPVGPGPAADTLRHLVERHAVLTGSQVAWDILAHWDDALPFFRQAVPRAAVEAVPNERPVRGSARARRPQAAD